MIKVENIDVYGWEAAIRGMRNPKNSWKLSDTKKFCNSSYLCKDCEHGCTIGEKDIFLMKRLVKAGTDHSKFMRMIIVTCDILAPLYWWKEMDTYKVGTTANSTSTMHKLASTPITLDCFEIDDYEPRLQLIDPIHVDTRISQFIEDLEQLRQLYNQTKDIRYWKELIRWLPESWLQTRTWTADYSVLRNIYHWRKNHKLTEWHQFCDFIVNNLPYGKELIEFDN